MRGVVVAVLAVACLLVPPHRAQAQTDQTLADIRQELSVLYIEIQRLKRELSTTGTPTTSVSDGSVLDRVTSIETALTRLTARTEQLSFRVDQIVQDGTNRIGDLEFRLVELEGGDISQLGQTTTLGGDVVETASPPVTSAPETELAIGEQADFDRASDALAASNFQVAADAFGAFVEAYPGSPLAAEAHLRRGDAYSGLGNTREAARAYLASFSAAPTGPIAPSALVQLGTSLGALGQVQQACLTLGEVAVRFPMSDAVARAQTEMTSLGCG